MIYRGEILPYKRIDEELKPLGKDNVKLLLQQYMLLYLSAFFASRVLMLKVLMPFGIAFFAAAFGILDRRAAFLTGCISIIGYLSTFNGYLSINHAVTIAVLMAVMFFINISNKNRVFIISIWAFAINTACNMLFHIKFISGGFLVYDLLLSLLESTIAMASCYIFSYGMPVCLSSKKRKVLSKEEVICLGLLLAIIVSGMWDVKYQGLSLRNMVAFFIVLVTGYTKGPAMGAASGVTIGLVSSISDVTMPVALGVYAFCGLISGIFKDLGKFITMVAFITSSALLSFYTEGLLNIKMMFLDTVIPSLLFLIIPQRKYEKFSSLIDGDKRSIELQKSYIERVKDLISLKLMNVFNTVSGLSNILEENVDNELSKKSEINGMVEKLADKVCSGCDRKGICWKAEFYYTYDSFVELLRLVEKSGKIGADNIPESLKRKCKRPTELSKQVNHLIEIFRLNNRWRRKLINSRKIVAEQTRGISELVRDMMEEVSTSVEFKNDIEEEIAVALDRKGLEFDDVLAIKNGRGKYEVTIYKQPCSGKQACSREFVGVISKTLGVSMQRDSNKCRIDRDGTMCQFRLVECVKYNIITAVSKASKEEISGDNYSYGEIGQGRYMVALSDGMGNGAWASNESRTTISLLEKFMEAGFERNTAIKAINSVLVLRSYDECFATIDMNIVDLYSGVGEFIKIGSAPTFIKSGMNVDVIKSMSLPAGILDEVDIESQIVEFKNGDMIVMVSDGVVDSSIEKEKWIVKALLEYDSGNPKDVADYIINRAKSNYKDRIGDDMTVVVSKIWKVM